MTCITLWHCQSKAWVKGEGNANHRWRGTLSLNNFLFSFFHQQADDEALTRLLQISLFLVASPILVKSMFFFFRSSLTLSIQIFLYLPLLPLNLITSLNSNQLISLALKYWRMTSIVTSSSTIPIAAKWLAFIILKSEPTLALPVKLFYFDWALCWWRGIFQRHKISRLSLRLHTY